MRLNRSPCAPPRCRPCLEPLEDRIVPAFDLAIDQVQSNFNVMSSDQINVRTFSASGDNAVLAVSEVTKALAAGMYVFVTSQDGGQQAGNIIVRPNAAIDIPLANFLTLRSANTALDTSVISIEAPINTKTMSLDVFGRGDVRVAANISTGTGGIRLLADVQNDDRGDNGVGALIVLDGVSVVTTRFLGLRGADIDIGTRSATLSGHLVRLVPSLPSLPINIGTETLVATDLDLSDAELARIVTSGPGFVEIGDSSQTGDLTVDSATPATTPGAGIELTQAPDGPGKIVLVDDGSAKPAIAGGTSSVVLNAGLGGIVTATGGNGVPDIATSGFVGLHTRGAIGALQPVELAANTLLGFDEPDRANLTVLGTLILARISSTGPVDIDVRGNLDLLGDISAPMRRVHLSFDGIAGLGSAMIVTSNTTLELVGATDVSVPQVLQGPPQSTMFNVSGFHSGEVQNAAIVGTVRFAQVQQVFGGDAADAFRIETADQPAIQKLDGAGGADILDFGRFVDSTVTISGPGRGDGFQGSAPGIEQFDNLNLRGALSFEPAVATCEMFATKFDLQGNPMGSALVAPGLFVNVAATAFGPQGQTIVFGLGADLRIYMAIFDARLQPVLGWLNFAPGSFFDVAVTTFSASDRPIVFGLGADLQIYAAAFNPNGSLAFGWYPVAPGEFFDLVPGRFGDRGTQPMLFALGLDQQVYGARLTTAGTLANGFFPVAPGTFNKVTVAERRDGSLELFGLGQNQMVYGADFGPAGDLRFGWFLTAPGVFQDIAAAPLGAGNLGGLSVGAFFNLDPLRPAFVALFKADGTLASGWQSLPQGVLQSSGTAAAEAVLYGIGLIGIDDPADNRNFALFKGAPGPFFALALAV